MSKQYMRVITICILFCFLGVSTALANSDLCLKCHRDVLNNATGEMVVHDPISQSRCKICHIPAETDATIPESVKQDHGGTGPSDKKWMEWLAESFVENTHQVALLPASVCDTELTIKLWYQNQQKQQSEILCPSFNSIPVELPPAVQPTISPLHLDHYHDKLFSRASLSWTTDVPCRCQLHYHFDDNKYVENADDFYTLKHNREIRNFDPANTKVSVQCADTFQQHTQGRFIPLSELTLRTVTPRNLQAHNTTSFSTKFKRIADLIEISVTTNQPAAISLGRVEQKKESLPIVRKPQGASELNNGLTSSHPTLSDEKQVNTTICFKCHLSTVEIASHPINVLPPPGMTIPDEYPLLSNGRLTCMTCHQRHSSNNEARLIKAGKKELCTGCHTNY